MNTMRTTWWTQLIVALAFGATSLPALAVTASPWTVVEEKDSLLQTDVCRVTSQAVKSALKVEVSISLPKNGDALPIVFLKVAKDPSLTEGLAWIQTGKKEQQALFRLENSTEGADSDIYWYAPKSQAKLIELIKDAKSLRVTFNPKTPSPIPAEISLSGTSSAFDHAQKCLKGKDVSATAFLTFLNNEGNLGEVIPDGVTAKSLFDLVQNSFKTYLSGKTATLALNDLRKQMAPLVAKESAAQKVLGGKQGALDKSQAKLDASNAQLASFQSKLTQLTTELPNLQAQLAAAQTDYTAKKATYEPVKQQITPLEQDVKSKKSTLESVSSDLSSARQDAANAQNALAQLNSRASSLSSQISQVQSALYSANSQLSRAQSDLNSFNPQWELRRELQSNGAEQAQNEARYKEQQAREISAHYDQVLNSARQAQAELSACRAVPNKDCTAEDARAQQGIRDEASVFQDRKHAQQEASWAQSNAENLFRQAEERVRSRQNELENYFRRAQSQASELKSQLSSLQSQLQNIQGSEIPSWESRLASDRQEISTLSRQKADAESRLAASRTALATLKAQLNFDAIEAAYVAAGAAQTAAQKAVNINISATASTQKSIQSTTDSITQQQGIIAKQTVDRDAAQTTLGGIQTQLAPSRAQEADLTKVIDGSKALLAKNRDLYQQESIKLATDL